MPGPESKLRGSCHCGDITLQVSLPPGSQALVPRRCDCGFCSRHGAEWISAADGRLEIQFADGAAAGRYRQGSNQADLVFCRRCGALTHVCIEESGRMLAAANSRMFDQSRLLAAAEPVSPQRLDAAEKLQRWRRLWFARVVLRNMPS